MLSAEIQYRESATAQYLWRVKSKADLEAAAIKRKLEKEKAALERRESREKARVDRLLEDASALRQARDIRNYVAEIRVALAANSAPMPVDADKWCDWAMAQANQIDPIFGGSFLDAMDHEQDDRRASALGA